MRHVCWEEGVSDPAAPAAPADDSAHPGSGKHGTASFCWALARVSSQDCVLCGAAVPSNGFAEHLAQQHHLTPADYKTIE